MDSQNSELVIDENEIFSRERARELITTSSLFNPNGKFVGFNYSALTEFIRYMNNYFGFIQNPNTYAFRMSSNIKWYFIKKEHIDEICKGIPGKSDDIAKAWTNNIKSAYYHKTSFDVDYKNQDNQVYYFEGTHIVPKINVKNLYQRPYSEYVEDIEVVA